MILAILASLMIGATGILLIFWVARSVSGTSEYEKFDDEISRIIESEIESDRKKEETLDPKTWNGYWLKLYLLTGRIPTSLEQPGMISIIAALVSSAIGFLVWPGFTQMPEGILAGLGFPIGALVTIRAYYIMESKKRTRTLETQLSLLISSLRANLQANQTPQSALMTVASEIPAPLGDELKLMKSDIEVNVPLNEALERLGARVPSREIKFLIAAIKIAVASGADLDPQLVIIQDIVDKRTRIRQKLASAVASVQPAILVSALVIPAMLIFNLFSSEQNKDFWFSIPGLVALAVVGFLYGIGLFITKKMVEGVEKT